MKELEKYLNDDFQLKSLIERTIQKKLKMVSKRKELAMEKVRKEQNEISRLSEILESIRKKD